MFIVSQYALQKSNACNNIDTSTYSIVIGLVIYGGIYLYFLFYNNEYLSLFNKFVIYIVGIDLLLSTFYTYNNINENKSFDSNEKSEVKSEDTTDDETDVEIDDETDDSSEDVLDLIPIPLSFEEIEEVQEDNQANIQEIQEDNQENVQENVQANVKNLDLQEPLLDSETLETVKKLQQENDMSSSQSIKKKRGRKPNSVKATM